MNKSEIARALAAQRKTRIKTCSECGQVGLMYGKQKYHPECAKKGWNRAYYEKHKKKT